MHIFWLFMAFLFFLVWIALLIWDSEAYRVWHLKMERKKRRLEEEAKKKKARELKWPEGLPYYIEEHEK